MSGISVITLFSLPMTLFILINSTNLVSLAFQRGSFNSHSVTITASALSWYVIGMIPQSLLVFLNRIYYSIERMKTPMVIGIFSATVFILICIYLVHHIGYLGIAMGTTLYAFIYTSLLFLFINNVVNITLRDIGRILWRPAASTSLCTIAAVLFMHYGHISNTMAVVFINGMIYFIGSILLLFLFKEPMVMLVYRNYIAALFSKKQMVDNSIS
ncbi:MAG: polysaccharide biosynthesis C-terminal domain-containing protein [Gammaproteobacteria bacterium]|nr:polysaccharide biosynthesis C-terminal domain-containing protein [Gammaproteobacteria bacterium]